MTHAILSNQEKYPSIYTMGGALKPLISNWAHILLKLCFVGVLLNVAPQLAGLINDIAQMEINTKDVMSNVHNIIVVLAIPFVRVKLLWLFWKVKDAQDMQNECHVAAHAGKQALARPLTCWLEGTFVLLNGVSIGQLFSSSPDDVNDTLSWVFGGLTAFATFIHMIGYVGVFFNWFMYRGIADSILDKSGKVVKGKV